MDRLLPTPWFALVVLLLSCGVTIAAPVRDFSGVVSHVTDGDTLWIRPGTGGPPRKIRLHGIDAPELCQSGGLAARDALRALVLDRAVQVKVLRNDDYQRGLARVTQRGEDVARLLVRQGQAWSYRYRRDPGPYAREEGQARAAGRGLFAARAGRGQPERPRDFRQRHGPCAPAQADGPQTRH